MEHGRLSWSDCPVVLLSDCVANPQEVDYLGRQAVSGILFPPPLVALTLSSFSSTSHLAQDPQTTWLLMARQTRVQHRVICCNLCLESPISPADTSSSYSTTSRLPPLLLHHTIDHINLHHTTLPVAH